jgi:hypothetical protein
VWNNSITFLWEKGVFSQKILNISSQRRRYTSAIFVLKINGNCTDSSQMCNCYNSGRNLILVTGGFGGLFLKVGAN